MIRLDVRGAAFRHSLSTPWIFEKVEISLSPGIYGLFGPNGSGKTTMLQCIAGIKAFSKGDIRFILDDRQLRDKGFRERLGYVSQEFAFYEEMKVKDFLIYVAGMKLIPPQLVPGRVAKLLSDFGLAGFGQFRIESLSTGQRRRLSIAQAMLNDPHLLLLDEPLEGLDLEERVQVMELLNELAGSSIILMVSHILMEIEHWVDQVLFIVDKHVLGPKSPQQWKSAMLHEAKGEWTMEAAHSELAPTLEDVYLEHVRRRSGMAL
ncbi:ABC transporter ATP-binding protein [Paenibacillus eucommiae]|uniref:ABC-type multidrug transport system ATPase subunit n=1 Tax=Paenibacillus eucommiae TaxID=1355755 RepID=A0ABS4INM2_9BACL|nr:ABC transporter ATP-binding protein [Paenibacillus eucommiae]MBP1988765.1 ABC-type multidrug transport system ATPase subunit [Paenibacillus eucommiae]